MCLINQRTSEDFLKCKPYFHHHCFCHESRTISFYFYSFVLKTRVGQLMRGNILRIVILTEAEIVVVRLEFFGPITITLICSKQVSFY